MQSIQFFWQRYLTHHAIEWSQIFSFFLTLVDFSTVKRSAESEDPLDQGSTGNERGLRAVPEAEIVHKVKLGVKRNNPTRLY